MTRDLVRYEEFGHAADLGLRARGRSMEELFANAALGMLWLLGCEPCPEGGGGEGTIELEGLDREHLLVRWLSEILYLYREGQAAFGIKFELMDERTLRARCRLTDLPDGFVPKREIKLVTHHGARITEKDGIFQAEVVLDI